MTETKRIGTVVDPPITDAFVDEVTDLWVRVTNAGGAVGFIPPVAHADVRPTAERTLAGVTGGTSTFVGLTDGGRLVAWCVLSDSGSPLRRHWRFVYRVQVDPDRQGSGLGARLMRAAADVARDRLGLTALHLSVRGGTGTEGFYATVGYRHVGRLPRAIRLTPGDDRDEILMWLDLTDATPATGRPGCPRLASAGDEATDGPG